MDKDMHGIERIEARGKKEGIELHRKFHAGITKFTLVWNATINFVWIFFWTLVGIAILLVLIKIVAGGFALSDILYILKIILLLVGILSAFVILMMLYFAIGLKKEVKSIEKALGISFCEEMARRGAIGKEYQDEEWFVESIPGNIEVMNRRFIKHWHGIKKEIVEDNTIYYIEFTDICDKKRKIGGHYKEHAEKMNDWYHYGNII